MTREELLEHFETVHRIYVESENFVPITVRGVTQFRSELGGLLTVAIAACYENAVKSVLIDYSSRHHRSFGAFIERNYEKLNSRVSVGDLYKYCRLADPIIHNSFKERLERRKLRYQSLARVEMLQAYEQVLKWRHSYAHAGQKDTSLEEAYRKFMEGRAVLFCFQEAFEEGCP